MRNLTLVVTTALVVVACNRQFAVEESVAQVEHVRAGVTVTPAHGATRDVVSVRRVAAGDVVRTDATGRAVLALDGGGRYVLDHNAAVRVDGARAAVLDAGRIWIAGGGEGGRTEDTVLAVGETVLHLRGARASVERRGARAVLSVLAGEVAFESGARRGAVHTGETAVIQGAETEVAAQRVFEDWSGGLADDLPAGGGDAAGLGAVAARQPSETGAPRWPMVMQRLDAHVVVRGDLAITTIDQTFFNPSATTVEGLYTFHTPPGAVLQMFGVDRRGRTVEGVVHERQQAAQQYQQQVYEGSTHDPALLEWDAPGRYHARLYPIPAGATRRIRVRYTQWLVPDSTGRRAYRLPLAALETRIGELRVDFDLEDANVSAVRSGVGAHIEDGHLYIAQSDVLPRADLVVELAGNRAGEATAMRVPAPGDPRGGYVRVAVQPPVDAAREPRDEGVDLVVVVDHSAATDELGLRLEQAFVEALVNALDPRDSVLVLAGDVTTRPLGFRDAALQPATADNRRAIIDALANDRLGGATDVGAMIAAAHRALRPGRNGAIVYVGDGNATVGEAQLPALRQMLGRLSPRPRLYAIAVGEEPRLDLLTGLAEPAGFAARVARRGDVARTAMDLLGHASRPLVRNFRVDLGPQVQAVYPTEPVDLPAGEPLVVVGRYTADLPKEVTVRAMWNGAEVTRRLPLAVTTIDDNADLRFRWATLRLDNLLARGESRPVIVELGTRFGLITPFTSLYVPSEDEVSALDARRREARVAEPSVFDFVPLVGCSRTRETAPNVRSPAPIAPPEQRAEQHEGGRGTRHAGSEGRMRATEAAPRSARYAIRGGSTAASPQAVEREVLAAPRAPGGGMPPMEPSAPTAAAAPASAPTTVSPFGGPSGGEDGTATGAVASDSIGQAFGQGGLGATGPGGGGSGEGTIGLGNVGTMGHGSGTGSGQGYGTAAGADRARSADGTVVRPASPIVTGRLAPEVIRRIVLRNLNQVRYCHERALTLNPDAQGRVIVRFTIGDDGAVIASSVAESSYASAEGAQCIANAVRRWQFPPVEDGGVVTVQYPFDLQAGERGAAARNVASAAPPPTRPENAGTATTDPAPSRCSDAAAVPLRDRIELWRERLADNSGGAAGALEVYRRARHACELPQWADRVALLRLMLARVGSIDGQIALYRGLGFDPAARTWTRNAILRALARSGDLARAQELGLGRLDAQTMTAALGRAATPEQRLAVLRELSRRYPDDLDLAMRFLEAAVAQRAGADVRTTAARLRAHPQADARARTAAGEALLAIGDETEARRAFSEIVEFAPDDPLARRRLGDIALSHGWADEAYRQFQMLAQQENDAPDVLLRQAMAARLAGRLDEAIRLAERVAAQSASGGGSAADVAASWIGVELALATLDRNIAPETVALLKARWRRSPAARAAGAVRVVMRWYHPDDGAELWVTLPGESQRRSDAIAESVFFESTVLADAPPSLSLEVRRSATARVGARAELIVIWNEGTADERVQRTELVLDDARPRFVFTATPSGLTDATPPVAPAVALAPQGGAR